MIRLAYALAIILLLANLAGPPAAAHAQQPDGIRIDAPLSDFQAGQPVQLQGLISSATLNIEIPHSYSVSAPAQLDLIIEPSPLLDRVRSSLTIDLNGRQVTSLRLSEQGASRQSVALPPEMFKRGANTLTFTGMLYLPTDRDGDCQDWDDPARWLNLAPESRLQLDLAQQATQFDLADFPNAFIEPLEGYLAPGAADEPPSGQPAVPTLLVLPDDPRQDDQTALVATAYALGSAAGSSLTWQPAVVFASQFDPAAASGYNVVLINTTPAGAGAQPAPVKDYVALQASPWNAQKAMLVIADRDRQDGYSPAEAFSDPARQAILRGPIAYLDPHPPAQPPAFKNRYTLEELGYLDRTVRGIGESSLVYRFFLPYNINPVTAGMELLMAHAPDLDPRFSSITVYVNGFSVAGIVPNDRSASQAPVAINLPASRLHPGVNFVRITFDLQVAYSSCKKAPESVWASVLSSSSFLFTFHEQTTVPTLADFPMPFSDNPGATFIPPDQPTGSLLSHITQLAFQLGQAALLTDRPPVVRPASQFNPQAEASPYQILVGLPAQNPVILQANQWLPQPFTADGTGLQNGYGVYIPTTDQSASLGLVQILPSPWQPKGVLLVVSGVDETGQEWAWEALLDPRQWSQMEGNLMVVGSEQRTAAEQTGQGQPVSYQTAADVSNVPVVGSFLQNINPASLVPAVVSIVAALLLVLLLLFILQTRNRV